MRKYLTVQAPVVTKNERKEAVTTWSDVETVWAEVVPLQGRELERERGNQATVTHRLRFYAVPNLRPSWRAVGDSGRVFQLLSVTDPTELGFEVVCLAVEKC